jgi:hypothetical protein
VKKTFVGPYILHDLRANGHLLKTIFNIFPRIHAYFGTYLRYIPVRIQESAHPNVEIP